MIKWKYYAKSSSSIYKRPNGRKSLVILSAKEFDYLMVELESNDYISFYDKAIKVDKGKRILFSEYLQNEKTEMSDNFKLVYTFNY